MEKIDYTYISPYNAFKPVRYPKAGKPFDPKFIGPPNQMWLLELFAMK